MLDLTRVWKFEGDDSIEDAKQMLAEINGDLKKMPLQIQGRLLAPTTFIEDANIANNELIVLEMKITFVPTEEI